VSRSSGYVVVQVIISEAVVLSEDSFAFCVDGVLDMVSGVALENSNASGTK
tara:strand:+ start:357 stop:509 length:153 start_codon:yes stop_codon:yes gene_type:complete